VLSPTSSAAAMAASAVSLFNFALDTGEEVDAGSREAVLEGMVLPCDPSDEEKVCVYLVMS